MSSIMIRDLPQTRQLERHAMSAVRGGTGGNSWLQGLGPVANVNVDVNQNINQLQYVNVAALNNVGVIGAGFVAPRLNVSPSQWANATAVV
ncbi:MAG TPA: hypothetical protein VG105_12845 [Paraburkholderia sp.]|jgi:hypothetical protein|nr:hypothetical protein [Paraburkholderia sp.]